LAITTARVRNTPTSTIVTQVRKSPVLEPKIPLAIPPPNAPLKPPPLPFWTRMIKINATALIRKRAATIFIIKEFAETANNGKTVMFVSLSIDSYTAARIIDKKLSAFKLAPPTSEPSTSCCCINSAALSGLTEPP